MNRLGHDPIEFGPSDDEYRGYDLREEETGRGPLILALAAGVLIVFAAVVWNTYRQGVRDGAGALPVIAGEPGPYKHRPDDAGGLVVPDQDVQLWREFESEGETAIADAGAAATEDESLLGAAPEGQGGPPLDLRPDMDAGDRDPRTGMPNALREEVQALADLDGRLKEIPETAPRIAALDPASAALAAQQGAPTAPQVRAQPQPATAPQFAFSNTGAFKVQLAAFRDQQAADTAWTQLTTRHRTQFIGAGKHIQRADLGARGVFYRLRAGSFADRAGATAFCDALKAAGEDCIVAQD